MQAACDNRFREKLHHAVALAAILGGLSLGSCTEKPDSHLLTADLAADEEPDRPQSRPAGPVRPYTVTLARPPAHLAQRPARKVPRFDPDTVMGLEPMAVDRMLGRPAGTRTEATTVEWTYTASNCSLSIFFYPDIATGTLKALNYNITNRQAGDQGGCVNFPIVARSDESG